MTTATVMSLSRLGSPGHSESVPEDFGDLEIVITPSPPAYKQLIDDLKKLRDAGAQSNTEAIVDAVHEGASASERTSSNRNRRKP
jgi:hypothetical protein